jgi:hypothetical protein
MRRRLQSAHALDLETPTMLTNKLNKEHALEGLGEGYARLYVVPYLESLNRDISYNNCV